MTPWTIAHQTLPFMEFPRQEHWSGLPFPSPGDLPKPGIKPEFSCIGRQILYCLKGRHWGSLSMQGIQVRSLIQKDPTCLGTTKPVHHNDWASPIEARSRNYWSPHALEPMFHNKRSHRNKPTHCNREVPPLTETREKLSQQQRPSIAKNKFKKSF